MPNNGFVSAVHLTSIVTKYNYFVTVLKWLFWKYVILRSIFLNCDFYFGDVLTLIDCRWMCDAAIGWNGWDVESSSLNLCLSFITTHSHSSQHCYSFSMAVRFALNNNLHDIMWLFAIPVACCCTSNKVWDTPKAEMLLYFCRNNCEL